VTTPRGVTSLLIQEMEYSFSVFIPTNKQTNNRHIVKAPKNTGDDPRAIGGLLSNLPHTQVNKTKQHTE